MISEKVASAKDIQEELEWRRSLAPVSIARTMRAEVENLMGDVAHERFKFGHTPTREELGKILNAVAWKHRIKSWGLSGKEHGYNVPMPNGRLIASDILHHHDSHIIVDCLISAGERSEPAWQVLGIQEDLSSRPWVAPVSTGDIIRPVDPVDPDDREEEIERLLQELIDGQQKQTAAIERSLNDLKAEVAKGIKVRW